MPATDEKPTRKRRMSAADRREAILDAALEEFSISGFHETSLEGVAEQAGISKALIYEHFASKRDLHDALLGRYMHKMLEGTISAIASAAPPEERLEAAADAFLRFVEENREPWRLIIRSPLDSGETDPAVGASLGRQQNEIGQAVAALLQSDVPAEMQEQEPDEGRFEIEMMAQQLVGAWRGVAIWWDDHRDVPRGRLLSTMMDLAWLGLERLSQGETWREE